MKTNTIISDEIESELQRILSAIDNRKDAVYATARYFLSLQGKQIIIDAEIVKNSSTIKEARNKILNQSF